jgi:DNA modification methylase
MKNIVHNCDCMEYMKTKPDDYYDLAIVDPPYNINKAIWDKWEKKENYIEFIIEFMIELQRIMKDNSSIYFFHNDFEQLAEIQYRIKKDTNYIFRQFIVWNKRFDGSKNKGYFDGYLAVNDLRNYQQLSEYILFYTFQDETGLTKIMDSCVYPIREYIRNEIIKAKGKINLKEINKILGTATNGGGVASSILSDKKTVPSFITREHYLKLRDWLNTGTEYKYLRTEYEYLRTEYEYLRTEYEYLRTEYKYLRTEYEYLRYYFNNMKTHHSVWNYDIQSSWHPTPKPRALIENILLHSARPGGIVFNPFNGSEIIRIACHDLGYDLEGCEKDYDYWKAQEERYKSHAAQGQLFDTKEIQGLIYDK